ncbi:flagellar brake protein [Neobacillus notoginsengisoli]|nr:PilZ domain-containing protein [Neobacillus notoginsengisoli]
MANTQIIILAALIIFISCSAIYFYSKEQKKAKQSKTKKTEKKDKSREHYRVHVSIDESLMEVKKMGAVNVDEIIKVKVLDVSTGGAGVLCDEDFPLKEMVFVRIHFYLNEELFSFNGRIVRKIENPERKKVIYGVQFLNLSPSDETKLIKEITAIQNERRKIAIK